MRRSIWKYHTVTNKLGIVNFFPKISPISPKWGVFALERPVFRLVATTNSYLQILSNFKNRKRREIDAVLTHRIELLLYFLLQSFLIFHFDDILIYPFPDKSSLQSGVLSKSLPIQMQITRTIIHRVTVFTQYYRFSRIVFGQINYLLNSGIHRANDVGSFGSASTPFIVNRSSRISMMEI